MKQGILVTAFKEPGWLERTIVRLGDGFSFFVHVDGKSKPEIVEGFFALSARYPNVKVFSRYRVNWGGKTHLLAILLLVEEALKEEMGYCHLITGQDYPLLSGEALLAEGERGLNYMEYAPLPNPGWKDGGYDRLLYYNFFDIFDANTMFRRRVLRRLASMQKFLFIRRTLPPDVRFHGGATYWSLTRECLEYVMRYAAEHPRLMKAFDHSFCAEELFFQMVLLNSPFKDTIINDPRRFIVWEHRHGSIPGILDESDLDAVLGSPAFFMRKIAYPESRRLVEQLDRQISGSGSDAAAGEGGS
jgi:hypothetical protein